MRNDDADKLADPKHPNRPASDWSEDQIETFMNLVSQLGSGQPADNLLEAFL